LPVIAMRSITAGCANTTRAHNTQTTATQRELVTTVSFGA
jgi:hypothetical protein